MNFIARLVLNLISYDMLLQLHNSFEEEGTMIEPFETEITFLVCSLVCMISIAYSDSSGTLGGLGTPFRRLWRCALLPIHRSTIAARIDHHDAQWR